MRHVSVHWQQVKCIISTICFIRWNVVSFPWPLNLIDIFHLQTRWPACLPLGPRPIRQNLLVPTERHHILPKYSESIGAGGLNTGILIHTTGIWISLVLCLGTIGIYFFFSNYVHSFAHRSVTLLLFLRIPGQGARRVKPKFVDAFIMKLLHLDFSLSFFASYLSNNSRAFWDTPLIRLNSTLVAQLIPGLLRP